MRKALAIPGFGRLLVAFALNELCWFVGSIALSVLVYHRTGSALGSAGFFLCSQALPGLLAPSLVGRLDRFSPRTILPVLYVAEAVLYGVLAWLTSRFVLVPVLVIIVLDGTLALVARSLAAGARTELLGPADLVREGGALLGNVSSIAFLLGPLIGGVVTAVGGTVAALVVDACLFALMSVSLRSSTIPTRIVHEGPQQRRLRAALHYVRGDPPVATLLWLMGLSMIFFTIPTPVEVVYTVHTLHAGTAGYGLFLSVWGGGSLVGSLGYARWQRAGPRPVIASASILLAVGFAVVATAPLLGVALAGAVVGGIGNGLAAPAFFTELLAITPQSWVALVTSLNQSLGQLTPGIGFALGGALVALASARFAFGVAAIGCAALAVLALVVLSDARMARGRAAGDPTVGSARDPAGGSDDRTPTVSGEAGTAV